MDSEKSGQLRAEGVFFFDPEDPIYADHFPGKPVVPGSLIIQAFLAAARKEGFIQPVNSVRDFRFKRFVSPGEYRYSLEPAGTLLKCRLYDGASAIVTGTLES
ncbi:MAG: hypothetical protein ABFD97_04410 [Syntrophobacter sp.]